MNDMNIRVIKELVAATELKNTLHSSVLIPQASEANKQMIEALTLWQRG